MSDTLPTLADFEARTRGTADAETRELIHRAALTVAQEQRVSYLRALDVVYSRALDREQPLPCHISTPDEKMAAAKRVHLREGVSIAEGWNRQASVPLCTSTTSLIFASAAVIGFSACISRSKRWQIRLRVGAEPKGQR